MQINVLNVAAFIIPKIKEEFAADYARFCNIMHIAEANSERHEGTHNFGKNYTLTVRFDKNSDPSNITVTGKIKNDTYLLSDNMLELRSGLPETILSAQRTRIDEGFLRLRDIIEIESDDIGQIIVVDIISSDTNIRYMLEPYRKSKDL